MTEGYRLPETFLTERLLIRRARSADAPAVFAAYAADPQVTRYLNWRPHEVLEQTRHFLMRADRDWTEGRRFAALIFARAEPGAVLGMIEPRPSRHVVEFGYVLRASAWGRGIMTEALSALVAQALEQPGIHRVQAFCDVENPASARVMEKAGLRLEGRLAAYLRHPNVSDLPRDALLYARSRTATQMQEGPHPEMRP